ncbi:MAG: flagellar motor switch protein FliN, partial [Rhodothermaceae bacterium]|nr:flagellar motor switch protein FliN [Rhodothermaceae bacterium]
LATAFEAASAALPDLRLVGADEGSPSKAGGEPRTFQVDTPEGVLTGAVYLAEVEPTEQAEAPPTGSLRVAPAAFADLGAEVLSPESGDGSMHPASFDLLREVELEITVELGRRSLPLAQVLRLAAGSVVELERLVGEPLGIYANGHLIAEGEAVVLGEQLGVRVTRLVAGARQALRPT